MRVSTISQIGAFTALDEGAGDWLRLDPNRCSGTEDAPLRTNLFQRSMQDGVEIEPPFDDAWILTLGGDLLITSDADGGSGTMAAEDTLLASLKSALDALKAAPDDLVYGGGTLSVWKYSPIESTRQSGVKAVTFGLVVDVS